MVTKESLEEKYESLNTTNLLEIVSLKDGYTELAVHAAKQELKKRNVPEDEVKNYKPVLNFGKNQLEEEHGIIDLDFWQKLIFFFLWMPRIRRYFNAGFISGGYILKSNQSSYYSIFGAVSTILSLVFAMNYFNSLGGILLVWSLGFLAAYLFDILYNKDRQIKNITEILSKEDRPFGYY